jgi:hypothetical protein
VGLAPHGCLIAILLTCWIASAADYFVDCAAGDDSASGTHSTTAWRSLEKVNKTTFAPADRIQIKRGTTCPGELWPKGSGEPGRPITIAAYGDGELPVINAKGLRSGARLFNQQHWVIRNIKVTGSSEYGIHISGDQGLLRDISLVDSVVHDVNSTAKMSNKRSGLVVVEAGPDQIFQGILIDGVTAYETNRWAGIIVSGGQYRAAVEFPRSSNVIIRNSVVHHVYGDGIVLFSVRNGIIERSAAWHTGLEPQRSIGTPNGIWTWTCDTCTVRETESYFSDSPGVDGGTYDVDWGNHRNLVENNYGHESQSYCLAVFGAGQRVTTQTEIRGNVCVGNGRSPRLARHHGGIHIMTWDKGFLDGVHIHHNVFLWEPALTAPLLQVNADITGTKANLFEQNQIAPAEVKISDEGLHRIEVANNRLVPAADLLQLPPASPPSRELRRPQFELQSLRGRPALVSFVGKTCQDCRSQAVVLESAAVQYAAKGLAAILVADQADAVKTDWHLRAARVQDGSLPGAKLPLTFLIDSAGQVLYRWEGYAPAKQVVFAVRKLLGSPVGSGER